MSEIKWIKITTDMFDDEKIRLIDSMPERDTILVIWLKILTLAGKCNKSGQLILSGSIGYDEEMLSTLFNRPINSIRLAMATFKRFNMIDELTEPDGKNPIYYITNWIKHQSIVENKEYWKVKQAEHRERQRSKLLENNSVDNKMSKNVNDMSMTCQKMSMTDVNDMSKTCQKNVNDCQTQEEEERNKKKEERRKKKEEEGNTVEEVIRSGGKPAPAVFDKNIITFNKNTNLLECDAELQDYLQKAYPDIDISQKLKEISVWLIANDEMITEIEKSGGNFMRFVVKWLIKNRSNANSKKTKKAKTYTISFNPDTASFVGTDDDYVSILKSKFLGIDVGAELKKMEAWLLNNPSRRPMKDYPRFINSWLTRAQDNASMRSSQFKSPQPTQTFAERKLQNSLNAVEQVKKDLLTADTKIT